MTVTSLSKVLTDMATDIYDIKLSADDAARLFKPDSTYTVELFEV